tara:strand:+ start:433 stop:1194 length:762 start_codon:yes stop_codon:yes gene_type:complete
MTTNSKKSVLHEIIAVESSKQKLAETLIQEGINTFTKKTNLFSGHTKEYIPFIETDALLVPEETIISETVEGKLEYVFKKLTGYFDLVLQKDATNQKAKSDLMIDGVLIASDLPATFLLGMESKFKSIRALVLSVPTLQPNIRWVGAGDQGEHIVKTEKPIETYRTQKVETPIVVVPATEHHPAQVQVKTEDKNVGINRTQNFSSAITPLRKSQMLERCDKMITALKTARQRANGQEVDMRVASKNLLNYITE